MFQRWCGRSSEKSDSFEKRRCHDRQRPLNTGEDGAVKNACQIDYIWLSWIDYIWLWSIIDYQWLSDRIHDFFVAIPRIQGFCSMAQASGYSTDRSLALHNVAANRLGGMSTMEQQISKTLDIEVLSLRSFKGTMVASIGKNNIHWDSSENVEPLKWHKFEESYSQCITMHHNALKNDPRVVACCSLRFLNHHFMIINVI